jgi:hypothetical protein
MEKVIAYRTKEGMVFESKVDAMKVEFKEEKENLKCIIQAYISLLSDRITEEKLLTNEGIFCEIEDALVRLRQLADEMHNFLVLQQRSSGE